MTDQDYMRRAIALAQRAVGRTNPNPMVGAVIVKDGRIIGEGYHREIGGLHAERSALAACTEPAEGATLYVTLEPCCHYGKTPPCTEAILENKLAKVVIGSRDPNPKVAGKGVQILREAGIEVKEDFLREECDAVNPVFFQYIRRKEPYIALKYAMTADGKTAANSGRSRWITGERARAHVHELRNYYTGILAGIGTVLADDPMLTCRLPDGRNPVRIILDSQLRIPTDCRLCGSTDQAPVIVACVEPKDRRSFDKKRAELESRGVEVLTVPEADGKVSIPELVQRLGAREIDGILVEGGGTVNASFVRAGCVHRVYAYVGAQIFGGGNRYTPVGGSGIEEVSDSLKLCNPKVRTFENDILIRYDVLEDQKEG